MVEIFDQEFAFISKLVYDHSRISLGEEKKQLVCARLNKRLTKLGIPSFRDYCTLLQSGKNPDELTNLIDAISTNFTHFFREMDHFTFLQQKVLPDFINHRKRNGEGPFRVWSAACSTGEEPYSLAIILAEYFQTIHPSSWNILATDISTRVLEKAQSGIFETNRLQFPHPEWLNRYFKRGEGKWEGHCKVKDLLRSQIEFRHLNLLDKHTLPETQFDLIFCRNVMIYFDHPTIRSLSESLYSKLKPGAYLMIGHAENLKNRPEGLKQVISSIFWKQQI